MSPVSRRLVPSTEETVDACIRDDLEIAGTGAVIEFEKGKRLGITAGADPACRVEIVTRLLAAQDVFDQGSKPFNPFILRFPRELLLN